MLALALLMSGTPLPWLDRRKAIFQHDAELQPEIVDAIDDGVAELVSRLPMSPLVPCTPYQSIITPSTPEASSAAGGTR